MLSILLFMGFRHQHEKEGHVSVLGISNRFPTQLSEVFLRWEPTSIDLSRKIHPLLHSHTDSSIILKGTVSVRVFDR